MSKSTTLFLITLLLFFSLTNAARPQPSVAAGVVLPKDSISNSNHRDVDAEMVDLNESCEGVGEDECLMRRTLVAHIDYIYTQKTKP